MSKPDDIQDIVAIGNKLDSILWQLIKKTEDGITLAEQHAVDEAKELFATLVDQFSALRLYQEKEARMLSEKEIQDKLKQTLHKAIFVEQKDVQEVVYDLRAFVQTKQPSKQEQWLIRLEKALKQLSEDHEKERSGLARLAKRKRAA